MLSSEYIVMKSVPYGEHALIISGLAPAGRIDFFIPDSNSKKNAGNCRGIGLFRLLNIEYIPRNSGDGLQRLKYCELAESFDMLAENTQNYLCACNFAIFLTNRLQANVKFPLTFEAVKFFLRRLANNIFPAKSLTAAKLLFFYEYGILPNPEDNNSQKILSQILEYATGNSEFPNITDVYFAKLMQWSENLEKYC